MSTLVIAEHNNQLLNPATRNAITAAKQLGNNVTLFVIGWQCEIVAEQAAKIAGVNTIWLANHKAYTHQLAEQLTELIIENAGSFKSIIASATTFGKNLIPRIAAKLDVAQVSDVSRIIEHNIFEHPIYAGNAIEKIKVLDEINVLTVRPTAFDPELNSQEPCCIEQINTIADGLGTQFVKHELSETSRPQLSNAKIVVSGGRALQNAEKFKLIEQLADALGAAVGASRAAVDAGFVSNDYQVGQTGKVVAPNLYIAVGISGAVQHLAGMKDSKVIVAINKDADAPIFQIADYGLVGDLFDLVPQLIEKIKSV